MSMMSLFDEELSVMESSAACPAKVIASRESKWEPVTRATCGLLLSRSYGEGSRVGSALRMLLDSQTLTTGCRVSGMIWKVKAMKLGQLRYRLVRSGRPTSGCEHSLWPTARQADWKGAATAQAPDCCLSRGWAPNLPEAIQIERAQLWPTPRAANNENRQTRPCPSELNGTHGKKLAGMVHLYNSQLWPTPRASEYKGTGPLDSSSHKHRTEKHYLDATVQEQEQQTGALSAEWVAMLMCVPCPLGSTSLPLPSSDDSDTRP